MKSYGLDLQHSDVNSNADLIISGTQFPSNPQTGSIFFLTIAVNDKDPGVYTFNGTEWITGDISNVIAGYGLVGGGDKGDVTVSLDTDVVTEIAQTTVQTALQQQPDPIAMSLIFGS